MGIALRRAVQHARDADASYRSAVGLIRRLEALSGKLSGGLDAVGIAEQVMDEADELIPTRSAGVFVRSANGLDGAAALLGRHAARARWPWAEELSAQVLGVRGDDAARAATSRIPLVANDEMIAVLVLDAAPQRRVRAPPSTLRSRLARHAVQLQAALLFGRVRDTATSEERQRIAREVHDGVAQDVASLGYLVDNLAAGATRPGPAGADRRCSAQEVTRVVTELRHSIFDLRHELAAGAGLGESLSAYANQVSATSPMAVHVTLDEEGPRLPGDVEYELLRIAQEAMANARKHSGAANLWLRCTVRPPYAEIEVRDDGTNRARAAQRLPGAEDHARALRAASVPSCASRSPPPDRPGTRVMVRVGSPSARRPR